MCQLSSSEMISDARFQSIDCIYYKLIGNVVQMNADYDVALEIILEGMICYRHQIQIEHFRDLNNRI